MQKEKVNTVVLAVLEKFVIEIREDKLYIILADECTNVSRNKLIVMVNYYINSISDEIAEIIISTVKVNAISF